MSEVSAGGSLGPEVIPHLLVFDGPFLVMLKRKKARRPYFGLWVENADLMVPMKSSSKGVNKETMNDQINAIMKESSSGRVEPDIFTKGIKGPIMPSGSIPAPKPVHRVMPVYPPTAEAMGIGGKVLVGIIINKRGRVAAARIVASDDPIFNQSALKAARSWRFTRPTASDGKHVNMYYFLPFIFHLATDIDDSGKRTSSPKTN